MTHAKRSRGPLAWQRPWNRKDQDFAAALIALGFNASRAARVVLGCRPSCAAQHGYRMRRRVIRKLQEARCEVCKPFRAPRSTFRLE